MYITFKTYKAAFSPIYTARYRPTLYSPISSNIKLCSFAVINGYTYRSNFQSINQCEIM